MSSWDEMRKAREGEYFERKNREALERLRQKQGEEKPRLSPVTGEPMEQIVISGVVVDKCKTSGGIWLDAGELEHLLEASKTENTSDGAFTGLMKSLIGIK